MRYSFVMVTAFYRIYPHSMDSTNLQAERFIVTTIDVLMSLKVNCQWQIKWVRIFLLKNDNFKNGYVSSEKIVLIIGGSSSGIDLTYAISASAAKVIFSHHTHNEKNIFATNVVKKGTIQKFTKSKVIFNDGSEETITDILFCTGKLAPIRSMHSSVNNNRKLISLS